MTPGPRLSCTDADDGSASARGGEPDFEARRVTHVVGAASSVLDCGCGSGRIAQALAGRAVDGIELDAALAEKARAHCREVVRGSVCDGDAWRTFAGRRYDAIVFCHVLEHLTDPIAALDHARRHLAPEGRLVVVLPNVATWRMRLSLLRGRWDYTDEGILDRTHVKFYTHKTARDFLCGAGLTVRSEELLAAPPAGSIARRAVVRGVRALVPLASTHAFLFDLQPEGAEA